MPWCPVLELPSNNELIYESMNECVGGKRCPWSKECGYVVGEKATVRRNDDRFELEKIVTKKPLSSSSSKEYKFLAVKCIEKDGEWNPQARPGQVRRSRCQKGGECEWNKT